MFDINIDKICRVCLKADPALSPLFHEITPEGVSFPDMITDCTNHSVFPDDEYPQLICNDCKERTRHAYCFKKLYEESHRRLTVFLASIHKDTEEDLKPSVSVNGFVRPEEVTAIHNWVPWNTSEADVIVKKEIIGPEVRCEQEVASGAYLGTNAEDPACNVPPEYLEKEALNIKQENVSDMDTATEESNSSFQMHPEASRIQDSPETSRSIEGDKNFLEGNTKSEHEANLEPSRLFQCDQCPKAFKRKYVLKRHSVTHLEEGPYQCTVCLRKFKSKSTLKDHIMCKHENNALEVKKRFQCEICAKRFKRKFYLAEHVLRHEGLKPFPCSNCERHFYSKHELNVHFRTHTGTLPYKCQDCDKAFTRVDQLTKHKRIHNGEKPYKCQDCDQVFAWLEELLLHKKFHTGERPYQCLLCPKNFAHPARLTSHMKHHDK